MTGFFGIVPKGALPMRVMRADGMGRDPDDVILAEITSHLNR